MPNNSGIFEAFDLPRGHDLESKLYATLRYSVTFCVLKTYPTNLHRLISAAIGRWVTSDPAELPFLPGRKKLCTNAVEYNP